MTPRSLSRRLLVTLAVLALTQAAGACFLGGGDGSESSEPNECVYNPQTHQCN